MSAIPTICPRKMKERKNKIDEYSFIDGRHEPRVRQFDNLIGYGWGGDEHWLENQSGAEVNRWFNVDPVGRPYKKTWWGPGVQVGVFVDKNLKSCVVRDQLSTVNKWLDDLEIDKCKGHTRSPHSLPTLTSHKSNHFPGFTNVSLPPVTLWLKCWNYLFYSSHFCFSSKWKIEECTEKLFHADSWMSSLLLLTVVVTWVGTSEKRDSIHTNLRVSKRVQSPPVSKKQLPESRLPRYNHGGTTEKWEEERKKKGGKSRYPSIVFSFRFIDS
jgi:hypothetical protein